MLNEKPLWIVLLLQTIEHSANMAKLSVAPTATHDKRAGWVNRVVGKMGCW